MFLFLCKESGMVYFSAVRCRLVNCPTRWSLYSYLDFWSLPSWQGNIAQLDVYWKMSKGFFFTFSQSIGWFTKLVPWGNPTINFWCFLSVSMNHCQPLWHKTHPAENYNLKIQWHTVSDLQRCPILLQKWYYNTMYPAQINYYSKLIFKFRCSLVASNHPPL